MADFPERALGELAAPLRAAIAIGPFGSRMKAETYVPFGVPVIRGTNIGPDKALVGEWVYVSDEFADGLPNCQLQPGDLVFPHRGSIGEVALVQKHHGKMLLSSSMMKISPDPKQADSEYLYYYFKGKKGREEILRFGSQVGTPGIGQPLASLKQFRVPLPDLGTQTKIAHILSKLDDKIELNRRMNETLEAMAQAIFRDWFVDFGPTLRKLEGATDPLTIMGGVVQDTERAQALADLFPAALGDDGLPDGWGFGRLEDVVELIYGKALTKSDRREGTVPVYGSGGVTGFHDTPLASGPSVIVGRKGTVGSLYWEDRSFYAIDTAFYVRSHLPMVYCYYLLQTLGLEGMNTDAAVPGLNRNNAYRLEVAQPSDQLIAEFGSIVGFLRAKMTANNTESDTLASTRDLLLPKLMSGEIRLCEAEGLIEATQ